MWLIDFWELCYFMNWEDLAADISIDGGCDGKAEEALEKLRNTVIAFHYISGVEMYEISCGVEFSRV